MCSDENVPLCNNETTMRTRGWAYLSRPIESEKVNNTPRFSGCAKYRKKFLSLGCFNKEYETARTGRELRIAGTWNRKNCAECAKRKTSLTPPRFPAQAWQALDCPRVLFKFAMLYPKIDSKLEPIWRSKKSPLASRGIVTRKTRIDSSCPFIPFIPFYVFPKKFPEVNTRS